MATKKTEEIDKYANFKYEIIFPEELREAKWLIEQGDFKDMDDYINCMTRMEISMMKEAEAEKKRKALKRKQAAKKRKMAK